MESKYNAYHFKVHPVNPGVEILIAELGEKNFESFIETEHGVSAFVQEHLDSEDILSGIHILYSDEFEISFEKETIEQVNWNQEWEKNFEPIDVDGICYIRAPFHEPKDVPYEIVIEPKMSFGTGHHETTYLMMKYILSMDLSDKTVLDMGCGTAILAILALQKGAERADAIDIDNWCYLNAVENAERNNIENLNVYEGDALLLTNRQDFYDVIIANINRNILMEDIPYYTKSLRAGGTILFSGFYEEDIPFINEEAERNGLVFEEKKERNHWAALKYIKK